MVLVLVLSVGAAGCLEMTPTESNDALVGKYQVSAVRSLNECGLGAFGADETLSFVMELRKSETGQALWVTAGGTVTGTVADSRMYFDASLAMDARADGSRPGPECIIERVDHVELDVSSTALDGEARYRFAPSRDSLCDDLLDEPALALRLPCDVHYALSGVATETESTE